MFIKIKLSSVFLLVGFGFFGCAGPQITHNTPHVFAQAKDASGQQPQLALGNRSSTEMLKYSGRTEKEPVRQKASIKPES
jgi:hypothetical protein